MLEAHDLAVDMLRVVNEILHQRSIWFSHDAEVGMKCT
jgi:hypothetical protein